MEPGLSNVFRFMPFWLHGMIFSYSTFYMNNKHTKFVFIAAITQIIDALEDMQLLITSRDAVVSHDILSDKKLAAVLKIFAIISSSNLSCEKSPSSDSMDISRDVLDVVLDALELGEASDVALNHMEQLRFLLSQPNFQVSI